MDGAAKDEDDPRATDVEPGSKARFGAYWFNVVAWDVFWAQLTAIWSDGDVPKWQRS